MSHDITQSQAAWNRFTDRLREIGEKIVGPIGARTAQERADGFRYLTSLVSAGYELEMESDPMRPVLMRMFTPTRSFVGDGPDALYHHARLDLMRSYELTVRRGDDIFFSIAAQGTDDDGMRFMPSHLIDRDIEWRDDGGTRVATIHIGRERPEGAANWLELDGDQPFILTRQYFPECVIAVDDGKYHQATMHVRCTDEVPPPGPRTEEGVSAGLDRILAFIEDTVDAGLGVSALTSASRISYGETDGSTPSRIGEDGKQVVDEDYDDDVFELVDAKVISNNLPGPGIGYAGVSYRLADDEVIVVSAKDVPCRYWSCQVFDHYLCAGDYRHRPVAINDRQTIFDDDGSFRIYACQHDPGVKNWISTEGRSRGQVVLRTLLAEVDIDPEFEVIKLDDIPDEDRV